MHKKAKPRKFEQRNSTFRDKEEHSKIKAKSKNSITRKAKRSVIKRKYSEQKQLQVIRKCKESREYEKNKSNFDGQNTTIYV